MSWIQRCWSRFVGIDYFYALTATEFRIRVVSYALTLLLLALLWFSKVVHYRPPRFRGGEGTNGDFFAIMGAPWTGHVPHIFIAVGIAGYFAFIRLPAELSYPTRSAVCVLSFLILFALSVVCFPNIPTY